jgi:hypothetical protein
MGQQFDRVAIVVGTVSIEYVVLETQVIQDFGHGQVADTLMLLRDPDVTFRGALRTEWGHHRFEIDEVAGSLAFA